MPPGYRTPQHFAFLSALDREELTVTRLSWRVRLLRNGTVWLDLVAPNGITIFDCFEISAE